MLYETAGEKDFARLIGGGELGIGEHIDLKLSEPKLTQNDFHIYRELQTEHLLLKTPGYISWVEGIPHDLLKLHVGMPLDTTVLPSIRLTRLAQGLAVIDVIDNQQFTEDAPLQLFVSNSGVERILHRNGQNFNSLCVATDRKKEYPWYLRHHYARTGARYDVFTGNMRAVYMSSGRDVGELSEEYTVVEFVRSPWQRKEINMPRILRNALENIPGFSFTVEPVFSVDKPRWATHIMARSDGLRLVTVDVMGFMRNLDSTMERLVIAQKHSKHALAIVPDPDRLSITAGLSQKFTNTDFPRELVNGQTIMHIGSYTASSDASGSGVLVVFLGVKTHSEYGSLPAVMVHDPEIEDMIYNRIKI